MTSIVLLDRDGTINVKAPEGSYIVSPDELELLDGAADAIRRLNEAGVPVAVVTNQRGIALGRMTEDDLSAVHARLAEMLARYGAHIDLWRHCPHGHDACDCRKPRPGMLTKALETLGGAPEASLMVGDSQSDLEAGRQAGVPSILLSPEHRPRTLAEAVQGWLGSPGDPVVDPA